MLSTAPKAHRRHFSTHCTNWIMSLSQLCFILLISCQAVRTSPVNYKPTVMDKENYPAVQEPQTPENPEPRKLTGFLQRVNSIEELVLKKMESKKRAEALAPSLLPFYFKSQPMHKSLSRNKRDLRTPRKISSSAIPLQMQVAMPAYYPFLMAEMMPGSVKTRHPSIIAVNGCPAYYIADHTGMCRQVFQYTVQFGQQSPNSFGPQQGLFGDQDNTNIHHPSHYQHIPNHYQPAAPSPIFFPQNIPDFSPQQSASFPSSTRLLSLLKKTKKFDLSFFNKQSQSSSSASGEVNNDDNIDSLRQQILSALKITKNMDTSNMGNADMRATTPDYDD